jgi:hypothetical protein
MAMPSGDVDAFVVAVEHPAVVLECQLLAEQPEAIGGGVDPAEEPCVRRTDAEHRHEMAAGVEGLGRAGQRVPKRRVDR